MTLGACMKIFQTRKKVPRESLAYIIDSTGAPVVYCFHFQLGQCFMQVYFISKKEFKPLIWRRYCYIFKKVIPFTFYAWASLIIVPLFILGVIPKLGKMKEAYKKSRKNRASL